MENTAGENNIFEEYLNAYLREHPEEAEKQFPKIAGIEGIYREKCRGICILYNYSMEHDRLGEAYFKVYDHDDIRFAERVAELHFKDSGMEYHIDPYGKNPWILNEKDIKKIQVFLDKYNEDYSPNEWDGYWYTNWQRLCYSWNSHNGLLPKLPSITEYYFEKYDIAGCWSSAAYIPSTQEIPDAWNYEPPKACVKKPAFRIGDVVSVIKSNVCQERIYVVRELVLIDIGIAKKYMYDVSPIDSDDEVYTYGENDLQFQYHDTIWEEYFTEQAGNSLPEWRGKPYNAKVFLYSGYFDCYREKRELIKDHNNDTIPPMYMRYILEWHTVYKRIDVVFASCEDIKEMEKKLDISCGDLHDLKWSITEKIDRIETNETEPNLKKETRQKIRFTDLELSLVAEINGRDISNGELNGHFPVNMTSSQIMKAVKEAYHTAHKIGLRKLQRVHDIRDIEYGMGKVINPIKGRGLYEGKAKNGLVIRFWYNFDLNLIEDAYPVIEKNYDKKSSTGKGGN